MRAPTLFYEAHLKQPKGFGLKTAEKPQAAHIWSIIMDKEKVSRRKLLLGRQGLICKSEVKWKAGTIF
jgi:hypothetical protein